MNAKNVSLCLVVLICAVLLLPGGAAMADLLAYDGFAYTTGSNLVGQGSAANVGWAGAWSESSDGPTTIGAGGLSYPGIGYAGNHATLGASTNSRMTRLLDTSLGGPFGQAGLVQGGRIGADGTTVYCSFLQQISTVPGNSPNNLRYYTVEIRKTGTGNYPDRVLLIGHDDIVPSPFYAARSPANEPYAIGSAGDPNVVYAPLGTEDTNVNFYVLKFTFDATGDRVDIYRNPTPGAEPATPTASLSGAGFDFSFDRVSITRFVGTNPVHRADEIRFGTTWSSVIPEPGSLALLLTASLCLAFRGRRRRN